MNRAETIANCKDWEAKLVGPNYNSKSNMAIFETLQAARLLLEAQAGYERRDPVQRWPFAETPGNFANRLYVAVGGRLEGNVLLSAVRTVLIEDPPTFADWVRGDHSGCLCPYCNPQDEKCSS